MLHHRSFVAGRVPRGSSHCLPVWVPNVTPAGAQGEPRHLGTSEIPGNNHSATRHDDDDDDDIRTGHTHVVGNPNKSRTCIPRNMSEIRIPLGRTHEGSNGGTNAGLRCATSPPSHPGGTHLVRHRTPPPKTPNPRVSIILYAISPRRNSRVKAYARFRRTRWFHSKHRNHKYCSTKKKSKEATRS